MKLMRKLFDGVCRGDFDLLENDELDKLSRTVRDGTYFSKKDNLEADRSWDGKKDSEDDNGDE